MRITPYKVSFTSMMMKESTQRHQQEWSIIPSSWCHNDINLLENLHVVVHHPSPVIEQTRAISHIKSLI